MKGMRMLTGICLSLALQSASAGEKTASIMQDIYGAIAYLLPLSVRTGDSATAWDKELIEAKFAVLTAGSEELVKHAKNEDAEFRFLARSLDRIVHEIGTAFREEWPDYAFYSLMELPPLSASPASAALPVFLSPRKSVTYQPEPLSWKPAAVTCLT